jgi:predicted ATPase
MLLGRDRELGLLEAKLGAAREGRPFALVVRGEPGIGKTALLIEAVRRADGFTVLATRGVEAHAALPFRALHALVAPLLDLRDALPPAQAQALGAAVDLEPPTPHDRFAVPAAVLGLLGIAAQRGPILVVADDAQWLDAASRDALRFVARRLPDAPIGVLAGGRAASTPADGFDVRGIEVLEVEPLDRAPARALLEQAAPDVATSVAEELLDAADGNPLALLETPRLLSAEERTGHTPLIAPPRPGEELEAAFAREVAGLPEDARRAVTVAAAMESGPVGRLLDALARVGLDETALAPAERVGTLSLADGQLAFRHPMVRAAAYHAAGEQERRAAHHTLAETVGDARIRAWHLAAGAHRADATVAAEL